MAERKPTRPYVFEAKLARFGWLYGVDVPAAVSRAVGARGYVPVAGTLNGATAFRATLIPRGGGLHRIWLNGETRSAARILPGKRVSIELRVDREPRGAPTPDDLAEALREEGVLETFESLPAGKRLHILRWVDDAVHETTRAKRIGRVLEVALAEREKRIDRELSRKSAERGFDP
jgi:hypothetical protein